MAGNGLVGIASGIEGADAGIGNGFVATSGGSQPTPLEPGHCQPLDREQDMCDSSAGFSQMLNSRNLARVMGRTLACTRKRRGCMTKMGTL